MASRANESLCRGLLVQASEIEYVTSISDSSDASCVCHVASKLSYYRETLLP